MTRKSSLKEKYNKLMKSSNCSSKSEKITASDEGLSQIVYLDIADETHYLTILHTRIFFGQVSLCIFARQVLCLKLICLKPCCWFFVLICLFVIVSFSLFSVYMLFFSHALRGILHQEFYKCYIIIIINYNPWRYSTVSKDLQVQIGSRHTV